VIKHTPVVDPEKVSVTMLALVATMFVTLVEAPVDPSITPLAS